MDTLPAGLQMGPVTLLVANLDLMKRYYSSVLGLTQLAEDASSVTLGSSSGEAMILSHYPNLKHASPSDAGLFHTAFLYPTKADLAAAVASVARHYPQSFTGSADHLVSEAFYFDDPEGNGVELYFDKDRTQWSWEHGQIQMGTFALDPNQFLSENLSFEKPNPTRVGHVHLSIGNLAQAQDFYVNQLGFEVTLNWGGTALFVSAGGYHHHMAMNIWRSRGAGRRPQVLGLGDVKIELPTKEDLEIVSERLSHYGSQIRAESNQVSIDDPWGNQVTLTAFGAH